MTVSAGARLLEGAPIAAEIRERVARDAATYAAVHGHPASLAVVVCGRDAPSMVYLERILKACAAAGIAGKAVDVPIEPGDPLEGRERALASAVRDLSADPTVAGIIVPT